MLIYHCEKQDEPALQVPAPFRLVSETRHERYQAELEEKVAAARRAEDEAAPAFK